MDINAFTKDIKDGLLNQMPYDEKNNGPHMRDVALGNNQIIPLGLDGFYFDIGNDYAEQHFPYYHILEDAEVIKKRGRGTKTSKGSQANISPSKRDYGIAKAVKSPTTGKYHIYQEYRKNVRGVRSQVSRATDYRYKGMTIINGKTFYSVANSNANAYVNRHYHYIEKILNGGLLDTLATKYGLERRRTKIDNSVETNLNEQEQMETFESELSWDNDFAD